MPRTVIIPPAYRSMLDGMSREQVEKEREIYRDAFRATWPYRDRILAAVTLPVHISRLRELRTYLAETNRV